MSRTVLVGLDLTSMGRRVADRARLVAEATGADVHLLHVLEPLGEAMIQPGLTKLMRNHQTAEAQKIRDWLAERSSVEVELDIVKGSPAWEIASRAKKSDLVVMGSSTIDVFRAGPTTKRVARKATTDVLIVRRQPRVPYRRLVAAVDFSEASRGAVQRSLEVAPDADLTVLFSLPSRFDPLLSDAGLFDVEVDASRGTRLEVAKDRMNEFCQSWNGQVRPLVADGSPSETIDEVVRRRNADLVVVGNRGASATRMVLLGSVAEGLVDHAPCDVLIARSGAAFRRP